MSLRRALVPLAMLALLGCRERRERQAVPAIVPDVGDTPTNPSSAPSSDPAPPADAPVAAPALPACRCLFGERAPRALTAPFDALDDCDILAAVFPDYDRDTEKSKAAGGTVRLDRAQRWETSGRALLAIIYYKGADADADFVCGQCRVAAHVAVVEVVAQGGAKLALVAKGQDPWRPKVEALFNGRPELDAAPLPFDGGETLLAMRTPWSTGMPGYWTGLTVYRLKGAALSIVFDKGVAWNANGMGGDDEIVASEVSMDPRAGGPNDLRMKTTDALCHRDFDKTGDPLVCGKKEPAGAERWRFDGKAYKRTEGKDAPLPKVLHKLWGW